MKKTRERGWQFIDERGERDGWFARRARGFSLKVEKKLNITYHFDSIPNDSSLKVFKNKYTIVEQKIIAATNRIDPTRFRTKTKLVVPDTLLSNFIEYSP